MSKAEPKPLTERDAAILRLVESATLSKPVTIRFIQCGLMAIGLGKPSERTIKKAIESLRLAGHQIGSSRGTWGAGGEMLTPPGYYLARTAHEKRQALKSYLAQAYSQLKLARIFSKGLKEDEQLQSAAEQLRLIEI